MMKFRKITGFLLATFLFSVMWCGISDELRAKEKNEIDHEFHRYRYPDYENEKNWTETSTAEKYEFFMIPEETLKGMSDIELVQAMIDYPFMIDLMDEPDRNVKEKEEFRKYMYKRCSAYRELVDRGRFEEVLTNALIKKRSKIKIPEWEEEIDRNYTESASYNGSEEMEQSFVIEGIIDVFLKTDEQSEESMKRAAVYVPTVYTPRGSQVIVERRYDTVDEKTRETIARSKARKYGVEYVAPASQSYNCHYYAWNWVWNAVYSPFCMYDPSPYWNDGSYYTTFGGDLATLTSDRGANLRVGSQIITYAKSDGLPQHSAVLREPASLAPVRSIGDDYCISKWGKNGFFRHKASQVPIDAYGTKLVYFKRS